MRASFIRTGSVPVQKLTLPPPNKVFLNCQLSISGDKIAVKNSPKTLMHLNSNDRSGSPARSLDRVFKVTSRLFTTSTPSEEYLSENEFSEISGENCIREQHYGEVCAERGHPVEEIGFYGGGSGDGGDHGIMNVTGGNGGNRIKIGAYYEEMLKSNPTDALLLGNYGKFLHEVEKDMVRAEEYYGRAIIANPEDGQLLSMYGKLIWETQRDEDRAKSYFDQALQAAPNDCTVLGSYAHFMWEAEEEGEANSLSFS